MTDQDKIYQVIYKAIDQINYARSKADQVKKEEGTALFGPDSSLDSLAFTVFVVAVEQIIEEDMGKTISLITNLSSALEDNPFRSVKALVKEIEGLLA
jgi:hypothetical protein